MAVDERHAAWQTEPRFAVRLLTESGAETDLASGLPDLTAATDLAFEWLNREDPAREGNVRLVIVRVDDAGARTVWMYPPAPRSAGQELVALFGFNPATWQPQSLTRPARSEPRRSLPTRRIPAPAEPEVREAAPQSSVPSAKDSRAVAVDRPPADADRRPARSELGHGATPPEEAVAGTRDWATLGRDVALAMRASWDDRLSRALLVVAAFSTWFAFALLEPAFFVLSLAMLAALWARRRQQAGVDADDDY